MKGLQILRRIYHCLFERRGKRMEYDFFGEDFIYLLV